MHLHLLPSRLVSYAFMFLAPILSTENVVGFLCIYVFSSDPEYRKCCMTSKELKFVKQSLKTFYLMLCTAYDGMHGSLEQDYA